MKTRQSRAIRLGTITLAGGLAGGVLLSLAVPTTMKRDPNDWREMIGVRQSDYSANTTPALAFEAPPEDLTPVHWQTAQQEYPDATLQDAAFAPVVDRLDYMQDAQVQPPEQLPVQMLKDRPAKIELARLDTSDAAGSSADAARDAAADARAVENGEIQPDEPVPGRADPRAALVIN